MKHALAILLVTLIAVAMAVPVSAHEGEHEDDDNPMFSEFTPIDGFDLDVTPTCEAQLEAFHVLFEKYNLWESTGISVITPDDPRHELLHAGELGLSIVEIGLPPTDGFSVTYDGCHGTIYTIECRCYQWAYPHGPDAPKCIDERCWILDTHYQHKWDC